MDRKSAKEFLDEYYTYRKSSEEVSIDDDCEEIRRRHEKKCNELEETLITALWQFH